MTRMDECTERLAAVGITNPWVTGAETEQQLVAIVLYGGDELAFHAGKLLAARLAPGVDVPLPSWY